MRSHGRHVGKRSAVLGRGGPQLEAVERRILLSTYALHSIPFVSDNGKLPAAVLTADSEGNLYGIRSGETWSIFEIARGSNSITPFADATAAGLGWSPMGGLTFDRDGNLYGTTTQGGTDSEAGTVFEIARGTRTITTLVSFTGLNGADPRQTLTVDAAGNLYGTTQNGGPNLEGTAFEIARGSGAVTVLAAFTSLDGRSSSPLVLDSSGNIYGTTSDGGLGGDGSVFELPKGSNQITTLATFNLNVGFHPVGTLVMDAMGNLYGTATGAAYDGFVFELQRGSNTISDIATLNDPGNGLTMDRAGNFFGTTSRGLADLHGTVFEVARGSSTATTLASFSDSDGTDPLGLTIDATGDLIGTDMLGGPNYSGTVFELVPNTAVTLTLAGGSNPAYTGQTLRFAASVTGGIPDGQTVSLLDASDNDAVVAVGTLINGSALLTISVKALAVGTHVLIAVYAGDAKHAPSESAPFVQTVLRGRPGRQP